jgi:hypothetical protein
VNNVAMRSEPGAMPVSFWVCSVPEPRRTEAERLAEAIHQARLCRFGAELPDTVYVSPDVAAATPPVGGITVVGLPGTPWCHFRFPTSEGQLTGSSGKYA